MSDLILVVLTLACVGCIIGITSILADVRNLLRWHLWVEYGTNPNRPRLPGYRILAVILGKKYPHQPEKSI